MHPQCPWCAAPITPQQWLMSSVPFRFACAQCRRQIPLKRWVVVLLSSYLALFAVTMALVAVTNLGDRTRMRILLALTFGMGLMVAVALELILLRLDPVRRS
jgi:prepilin signal peptidase PulO-like enzyme (type II secretory pathway)